MACAMQWLKTTPQPAATKALRLASAPPKPYPLASEKSRFLSAPSNAVGMRPNHRRRRRSRPQTASRAVKGLGANATPGLQGKEKTEGMRHGAGNSFALIRSIIRNYQVDNRRRSRRPPTPGHARRPGRNSTDRRSDSLNLTRPSRRTPRTRPRSRTTSARRVWSPSRRRRGSPFRARPRCPGLPRNSGRNCR